MWQGLSVFAAVPARGGSKGVPRKNLRALAGRSLIARAADFVTGLDWLDAALVSTDDAEIRDAAVAAGLEAPFLRPEELSGDTAEAIGVWRHAWLACEERHGHRFDLGLYLEPTSPLRRQEDVTRCLEAITRDGFSTAATVSPTPSSFSFQKSLAIDETGRLDFCAPRGERLNRRQLVPQTWHRNGLCYAARREAILEQGEIIGEACGGVAVERRVVNIDEAFDFAIAELILAGGHDG